MRRWLRILSTALVTAGLVVLLDAAVTLAWQEPVSALRGWLGQREAAEQLEELQEKFTPGGKERLSAARAARLADRFAREITTGQGIGLLKVAAIDVNFVMVEGTDTETLRKGPGRYPETVLPGQRGTVGIAGHRTTYLAPFRNIDEIEKGDEAVLEMPYGHFTYRFEKQGIVEPSQVGVVRDVDHERIVLTACHPLYSADKRIVVFMRLTRIEPP